MDYPSVTLTGYFVNWFGIRADSNNIHEYVFTNNVRDQRLELFRHKPFTNNVHEHVVHEQPFTNIQTPFTNRSRTLSQKTANAAIKAQPRLQQARLSWRLEESATCAKWMTQIQVCQH